MGGFRGKEWGKDGHRDRLIAGLLIRFDVYRRGDGRQLKMSRGYPPIYVPSVHVRYLSICVLLSIYLSIQDMYGLSSPHFLMLKQEEEGGNVRIFFMCSPPHPSSPQSLTLPSPEGKYGKHIDVCVCLCVCVSSSLNHWA